MGIEELYGIHFSMTDQTVRSVAELLGPGIRNAVLVNNPDEKNELQLLTPAFTVFQSDTWLWLVKYMGDLLLYMEACIASSKNPLQSSDTMECHRMLKLSQMQSYTMSYCTSWDCPRMANYQLSRVSTDSQVTLYILGLSEDGQLPIVKSIHGFPSYIVHPGTVRGCPTAYIYPLSEYTWIPKLFQRL